MTWFVDDHFKSHREYLAFLSRVGGYGLAAVLVVLNATIYAFPNHYTLPGDFFKYGFAFTYMIDNLLRVILLDFMEIFDLHLSGIEPITTFSRAIVFLSRLLLSITIANAIISAASPDEFKRGLEKSRDLLIKFIRFAVYSYLSDWIISSLIVFNLIIALAAAYRII